jgi:peptidoglycan/LPS O-acetylase OafA/YrhL
MFSARWLIWLGVASYSLYLTHYPVIALAKQIHAAPVWAFSATLAVGFGFWFVAERPLVYTSLRDRAIARTELELSTVVQRFGIGRWSLTFVRRRPSIEELQAIA